MTEIEAIEKGFERIAMAMSVPIGSRLWTVSQICEYFSVKSSAAYKSILCRPDFPEAVKIDDGPKRWVAGEVMQWAESQRERRGRK